MREISTAVLGVTEGNGHPFSFSAIVNGYDDHGMAAAGWAGIHDYLRRRDRSEFGLPPLRITHAWTQDQALTAQLCAACRIPHAVADLATLPRAVEAVIIARDDHERHWELARPFLEAGLPVFLDKPLSLDATDVRRFRPYLEAGKLMTGSGLRFARELDEPRAELAAYGRLALVRGAVVLDWERYGVHMVEAILGLLPARPVAVTAHRCDHASVAIELDDGCLALVDALGAVPKSFRIDLFGSGRNSTHEVADNFSMFRRMLWHFARMVESGEPPIPPERTLDVVRVLIAGRMSRHERRRVTIDELGI
ncbi:MAG TPA: Gfo/Idh/MocA family oxidoreductase [Candidatus Krumholzibacteria bacterium]|nr:Gfo/Idh/MocA family oxidoreductase [Candidatus Krumholzibacteria bacterium]HPD70993.1 Gfo/Idh/MocA family oxidoreductase [Candidatus Krumholzibacteria bacterium]HRY39307.1 Gfo/Idh/MocA family oxidoreductase [Candidatus Krumholzibacteria bacterium]